MSDDFDVFLCHNSSDKSAVRELADALELRKLRIWLDERELIPAGLGRKGSKRPSRVQSQWRAGRPRWPRALAGGRDARGAFAWCGEPVANQLLGEAVAACRSALEIRTREQSPWRWASTRISEGTALAALSLFAEAAAAYREPLELD